MASEGSNNNVLGPLGSKRTSLFGHLSGAGLDSLNRRSNKLNISGAKSELGFMNGPSRPSLKGGKKTAPRNSMNPFEPMASPSKAINTFDKSSMMSRFSYMSANTVFLQYRTNQLYYAALA